MLHLRREFCDGDRRFPPIDSWRPHGAKQLGEMTARNDETVKSNYANLHLDIGVDAVSELVESGESVKHLRF